MKLAADRAELGGHVPVHERHKINCFFALFFFFNAH
jgi:hypothetical protein